MKSPIGLAAFAGAALLLTGCGSDSDLPDSAEPDEALPVESEADEDVSADEDAPVEEDAPAGADEEADADADADADAEEDAPENVEAVEGLGAVRVNESVTYSITELRKCEPIEDDMIERELELTGLGEHDGERVQIDVYLETIAGMPHDNISWAGPEGVFGSDPLDGSDSDASITWGPDNASVLGSATMFDSLAGEEQILVDFELQVPEQTVACR